MDVICFHETTKAPWDTRTSHKGSEAVVERSRGN